VTRSVFNRSQFTPFGLWVRQYCRDSNTGLSVTNLDYVFEDFRKKRIMILEEKQNGGMLGYGQRLTFQIVHQGLQSANWNPVYEYWGVYVLQFPAGCDMPGPGMLLNNRLITSEQLCDHCNFKQKFCDGLFNF
jgi:hypothetical protein